MINRRVLEDLLQQSLGPYRDRDILHETACQMQGTTKPVLYSFVLEHDGHVIGLDESERPLDGRDDRTFRFRGMLKIANPGWLSDFGLKIVETELNLRATERALREGERRPAQLTLEDLFKDGLLTVSSDATWHEDEPRLTILIQGEKNMPAIFMHSTKVPNGLLWNSKTHNRNYAIATMDVESYSLSENFFWRWRLLALMKKIADLYPYIPPQKRTPIWFVEKYLANFASPPGDKHLRLLFDEDDTDIDEASGRTVTPRRLLVPHASEILGLLAAHAEWFITNNELSRKKLFDISSWDVFARNAREERKEAARHGVRWGWPVGMEANEESSDGSEGDDDELIKLVRKNPVIGKSNKTVFRKIELARAKSNRKTKASMSSSGSGSEGDAPGGAGYEYVSDFSVSSGAEENDSDQRLEEEEAVNRIPWQLQIPPLLPDVDARWWCPLRGCSHQIDLHNLGEEETRGVPEDLVAYILEKRWRNAAYDEKVLRGFKYMVTNHYLKHFEERGVKMQKKDGRMRFTCINGRRRRRGPNEPIRGPMPPRGTLGGESRVVPIVHIPQAEHFQ